MPLHLPGLSRRQFITRTLAGGIAVLTASRSWAQAAAAEERWALLSDTHISADLARVQRDVNMADHLRAVVAELAQQPASHVLVNGDLSLNEGLPGDYDAFMDLLRPLADKGWGLHLGLGNHDAREVFWQRITAQASLPRPLAGRQISVLETPLANWFILDSLHQTLVTPGTLGEEQRAWLAQALDERPNKPALIMLHHDPIPRTDGKQPGLTDHQALLGLLTSRRQVKALFCGHTHKWRTEEAEGLHLINLPAVAYTFDKTELSGYTDCRLTAAGMKLERRAWDGKHPAHGKTFEFSWRA